MGDLTIKDEPLPNVKTEIEPILHRNEENESTVLLVPGLSTQNIKSEDLSELENMDMEVEYSSLLENTWKEDVKEKGCIYADEENRQPNKTDSWATGKDSFEYDDGKHSSSHSGLEILPMINPEKPFKYDGCHYSATQSCSLSSNTKEHTREKTFEFAESHYSTGQKSNLRRHMMKQIGERPFQCDKCDYCTAHKSQLKKHKMGHTGPSNTGE